MNDAQLKPCPFCGTTMQVAMKDAMLCLECYASGPQNEDRKEAWNRRADLPATRAQIAASPEVRAMVEALERIAKCRHVDAFNREGPSYEAGIALVALAAFKAMEAGG